MIFRSQTFWVLLSALFISSLGLKNDVYDVTAQDDTERPLREKQDKAERAKLAQEIGRFGTMSKAMRDAAELAIKYRLEMNEEDQYLIQFAYKVIVDARRSALGFIYSKMQDLKGKNSNSKEYSMKTVEEMREEIEMEVQVICEDVVKLTESLLAIEKNDKTKIFFYTMKGDYHRYNSEVKKDNERNVEAKNALNSYENAYDIAARTMEPINAQRLGIAIKIAVLYNDVFQLTHLAYEKSKEAVNKAERYLENNPDRESGFTEEARQTLQLLKGNRDFLKTLPAAQKGDTRSKATQG